MTSLAHRLAPARAGLAAAWQRIRAALLPQECLLCAGNAHDALLCPPCAAHLPRLPENLCPICADVSPAQAICGACLRAPRYFDTTIAAFHYHFPVDRLVQSLKYAQRIATADFFAQAMLAGPHPAGDIIIPLPLHPQRLAERGFNQSVAIARPLARALRLPLELRGCLRNRNTVTQASLPWKERRENIRHAFDCTIDLTGKSIIVVDDVMTTGATLDEFSRTLKAHGATRVSNWLAARTLSD